MSQSLLTRHPSPNPTESLLGYVVRLTEVNGYASPRGLYRLAEMKASETSARNFCCSKLAAITNHPSSLLERLAFRPPQAESDALCILGNPIGATYLNLTRARACPDCVAEKGFVEAHWHIDLMVACPLHKRAPVWYCPECKKPLSWARAELLACKCGAPFQPPSKAIFSMAELQLLDVIRRKALGDHTLNEDACMPGCLFAELDLQSILSLVQFLGNHRLSASWSKVPGTPRDVLQAAAKVLTEWPCNFRKLLDDLSPQQSNSGLPIEDIANVYKLVGQRMDFRLGRSPETNHPMHDVGKIGAGRLSRPDAPETDSDEELLR